MGRQSRSWSFCLRRYSHQSWPFQRHALLPEQSPNRTTKTKTWISLRRIMVQASWHSLGRVRWAIGHLQRRPSSRGRPQPRPHARLHTSLGAVGTHVAEPSIHSNQPAWLCHCGEDGDLKSPSHAIRDASGRTLPDGRTVTYTPMVPGVHRVTHSRRIPAHPILVFGGWCKCCVLPVSLALLGSEQRQM